MRVSQASPRPAWSSTLWMDLGSFSLFKPICHLGSPYQSPERKTFWGKRAWTLQEQLLSRRCLTFLEDHICWTCSAAKWHEDVDLEQYGWRIEWNQDRDELSLSMAHYGKLVENYSSGLLTRDTNIYDAFAGIMEELPEKVTWGIPRSRFEEYLDWFENVLGSRQGLIWRNMPLAPSWSWMAWKGNIEIRHIGMWGLDHPANSEIACYQLRETGNTLERISNAKLPPDALIRDTKCTLRDMPRGVTLERLHLVFWASSAILCVCKRPLRQSQGEFDIYVPSGCQYPFPVGVYFQFALRCPCGWLQVVAVRRQCWVRFSSSTMPASRYYS